jgi:uncharacterized DUF497 family protein
MNRNRETDWDFFAEFLEKTDFKQVLAEKEEQPTFEVYPASQAILEKIEGPRHRLPFEAVREVFYNPSLRPLISKTREGKQRAIGESFSGQALVVIFVRDSEGNIRVISARDKLSKEETRLLRRQKQMRT